MTDEELMTAELSEAQIQAELEQKNAEKLLSLQAELNETKEKFLQLCEDFFSQNGEGELKEIAIERKALRARINDIGKTEIVEGGDGSEEKPFVFDEVSDLIPNAFYTYNGKKYVYMGVAQAKTTWADVESVMGEWY